MTPRETVLSFSLPGDSLSLSLPLFRFFFFVPSAVKTKINSLPSKSDVLSELRFFRDTPGWFLARRFPQFSPELYFYTHPTAGDRSYITMGGGERGGTRACAFPTGATGSFAVFKSVPRYFARDRGTVNVSSHGRVNRTNFGLSRSPKL